MMETLFELRSISGYCRLFDFYDEADMARDELVRAGRFAYGDLFITRVVTE